MVFTERHGCLVERSENIPVPSGRGKGSPERALREGQSEDEPSITVVELVGYKQEQ